MPVSEIEAYAEEMTAIMAEESLLNVSRMNIGFGLMKKRESQKVINRWRRAARQKPESKKKRFNPRDPDVRVKTAFMGLGVREMPRGGE